MRSEPFAARQETSAERKAISRLLQDRRGVTAIEYALIAALIAVAAIAAFTLLGTDLSSTFSYIATQV